MKTYELGEEWTGRGYESRGGTLEITIKSPRGRECSMSIFPDDRLSEFGGEANVEFSTLTLALTDKMVVRAIKLAGLLRDDIVREEPESVWSGVEF